MNTCEERLQLLHDLIVQEEWGAIELHLGAALLETATKMVNASLTLSSLLGISSSEAQNMGVLFKATLENTEGFPVLLECDFKFESEKEILEFQEKFKNRLSQMQEGAHPLINYEISYEVMEKKEKN